MSPEKVREAVSKYQVILGNKYGTRAERNMESTELRERLNHLDWMSEQIYSFLNEGRLDKAFRWLGFMQGAFWALGIQTIEESKKDNTPDGEEFSKQRV